MAGTPRRGPALTLVTIDPGPDLYSAWGHSALRVQDPASGRDLVYDFGVFRPTPAHVRDLFLRGATYSLGIRSWGRAVARAEAQGRGIRGQAIHLSAARARALVDALEARRQSGAGSYRYDVVANNCTTRLRDVVDEALAGALRTATVRLPSTETFRDASDRLLAHRPLLRFGVNLLHGPSSDQAPSVWGAMWLPGTLFESLEAIRTGQLPASLPAGTSIGGPAAVVPWPELARRPGSGDAGWTALRVAAILLYVLLLLLPALAPGLRAAPVLLLVGAVAWSAVAGLTGLALAVLRTSDIALYADNLNALALHPALLLCPWLVVGARRSRWALAGLALFVVLPAAGMVAQPLVGQAAWPYLLLAFVVQATLLVGAVRSAWPPTVRRAAPVSGGC